MFGTIHTELYAGSAEDVKQALRFPIDRIELNCALELGGLTPTLACLKRVKQMTDLPVVCMVRPRAGDFCYSEELFSVMCTEAEELLDQGADGIVFGFLNEDHTINPYRTRVLADLANQRSKTAVFHRAFDEIRDPIHGAELLAELGIHRILTSGQKDTALQGASLIRALREQFRDRIEFLPGAGINAATVCGVVEAAGSGWIHLSAARTMSEKSRRFDPDILQAVYNVLSSR